MDALFTTAPGFAIPLRNRLPDVEYSAPGKIVASSTEGDKVGGLPSGARTRATETQESQININNATEKQFTTSTDPEDKFDNLVGLNQKSVVQTEESQIDIATMANYILDPAEIPAVLYRIVRARGEEPFKADSWLALTKNSGGPKMPNTETKFLEEVVNHVRCTNTERKHIFFKPPVGTYPTPFVSVRGDKESAEQLINALKKKKHVKEADPRSVESFGQNFTLHEIDGAKLRKMGVVVFRLKDIPDPNNERDDARDGEYLIWSGIPKEAVLLTRPWGLGWSGIASKARFQLLEVVPVTPTKQTSDGIKFEQKSGDTQGGCTEGSLTSSSEGSEDKQYNIIGLLKHYPYKATPSSASSYLVNWGGGYDPTWENTNNIADDAIEEYWENRKKPKKVKNTRKMTKRNSGLFSKSKQSQTKTGQGMFESREDVIKDSPKF